MKLPKNYSSIAIHGSEEVSEEASGSLRPTPKHLKLLGRVYLLFSALPILLACMGYFFLEESCHR